VSATRHDMGNALPKHEAEVISVPMYNIVHLTQYFAGDKIEKNEMGWACGAYE